MDSYSGSEPRLLISFRLGNETNGQPLQLNDEKSEWKRAILSLWFHPMSRIPLLVRIMQLCMTKLTSRQTELRYSYDLFCLNE